MNTGVYGGAASMATLQKWQEALTRDIASASQAGYKKSAVGISSASLGRIAGDHGNFQSHLEGSMPEVRVGVSFDQGPLKPTGDSFDFAISGDGFFKSQGEQGQRIYKRGGHFHLNTSRQLVDGHNNLILGLGGPIQVNAADGDLYCDSNGRLYQGDKFLDQFAITKADRPEAFIRVPGGFVIDPSIDLKLEDVDSPSVHQGFIEESNGSAMESMIGLLEVTRAQESNQRLINALDERTQRSLKVLGSAH